MSRSDAVMKVEDFNDYHKLIRSFRFWIDIAMWLIVIFGVILIIRRVFGGG